MSAQADFAAVLLAPTFACLPGLKAWNGSDPAKRFGVYRNNVVVSLVDAMADSYPVVQALVGDEFFRAMAGEFVRRSPPRSPVLAWYGGGFADFISSFEPAAGLPYLPDVARLEWLRVEAWHAADATALSMDELAALLADEERLPSTRFTLHPALRVMISAHPVVSLWAAHQEDDPAAVLSGVDMTQSEAALLVRPELGVEIVPIDTATADFIQNLQSGATLGDAGLLDLDLPAALGLLMRTGAFVGILTPESPR